MTPEITQDNLYLLLPSKVAWLVDMLHHHQGLSIVAAIRKIYSSTTYSGLEKEATKKWHLGPVALYEELTENQ
ncbi:MAG: hypothetical protein IJU62_00100 [Muribaculaceae bacterium]|nr:hypothetical protein [Muribaculaceae bacterium]